MTDTSSQPHIIHSADVSHHYSNTTSINHAFDSIVESLNPRNTSPTQPTYSKDKEDKNYTPSYPAVPSVVLPPTTTTALYPPPQPPVNTVDEPLYVNAKQYHRILKRREARAKLEELNKLAKARKPYLHESRHKHAMRRPRGPGGRFLTATEVMELEKMNKEKKEEGDMNES
ncbi:CCAAT-binding transcription factor (CBF-B/NF-YA) subunit B-domain-containing protein [Pilobolus umbonatus]|nr:CCAAT-binding transcription factor (CBF-B/NF-YA) subunit B-domain-containing protein [Pilobolus umbonatus]